MARPVTTQLVQDFYRARLTRDPERIEPFLDDDVDWMISGPVELLRFCGQKRGKAEALEVMVRLMPALLHVTRMDLDAVLIDGDMASTFNRVTAVQLSTGRTISYRQAQFLRFRDRKIAWYRGLIDSFDAAEQMIGRPISLSPDAELATPAGLVAV